MPVWQALRVGGCCARVLLSFQTISSEPSMAALVLVVLVSMAIYAWIASPLVIGGTVLLKTIWLAWLPLLLLAWLLAGKDGS